MRLGNTPTVCRKSYVHPAVLTAFEAGELQLVVEAAAEEAAAVNGLEPEELAVMAFLRKRIAVAEATQDLAAAASNLKRAAAEAVAGL